MTSITTHADKYQVLEKIGHGSFGIIRKVKRKSDGHILCRKEISYIRMSQKEREQLYAEFSILNSLKHPNIVGYYHREHLKSTQDLHIYMEYCGGGDLGQYIKNLQTKNQYAEEEFVWSVFAQLVTALYRCHYGVDPPEVNRNFLCTDNTSRPTGLRTKNQVMILHRDLKPENVFLGEDNSVKLGDFGLSKLMQSHDFASTYVGTPFYMSPEICAAERYTLQSDVWSLGCLMYELCTKEPPFQAKTHFNLVQKIKEGRILPLPHIYSAELQNVVKNCLKTNPLARPDTASLLQLPMVRLMRKEREVVELGKTLRLKEEEAVQKCNQAKAAISNLELAEEKLKSEIDSTVRREWEVKGRLEIDRQIQIETEKLQLRFEEEVKTRVQAEVDEKLRASAAEQSLRSNSPLSLPQSSISAGCESDFPSTTDLSSVSTEPPSSSELPNPAQTKKTRRTPFARARTQYDSPVDVQMVEPSPMSIASLSLSPRRLAAAVIPNSKNIFAKAAEQRAKWEPRLPSPVGSDEEHNEDEEDTLPDLPSPTRPSRAVAQNLFKQQTRPGLLRQKTAPTSQSNPQPSLFPCNTISQAPVMPILAETSHPQQLVNPPKPASPNRRLTKLPSSASVKKLAPGESGSPVRRAPSKPSIKGSKGGDEMFKAVVHRNLISAGMSPGGRTLVELAQARAGGNPHPTPSALEIEDEVPLWDPEKDEMPSPFIVRGGKGMNLRRL